MLKPYKMKTVKQLLNKIDFFLAFIFIMPFIYGTLYDFSTLIITSILQLILIIKFIKNKKLKIDLNYTFIFLGILFICSLLTVIWAVDKNDSIIGTLRYSSLLVFTTLLVQYEPEKKSSILKTIAYSAIAMLILSLILGIIPITRDVVFTNNGRIKGLFEYANTFALFLLLSLIIISQSKNDKMGIALSGILLFGIILTGSRTTFILTIAYIIYWSLNKKNTKRKIYIITYLSIFALFILYVWIINKQSVLGRMFLVTLNSRTLLERLVYWQDGLKLLKNNIFGHGYMGYFYKVYENQTGPYQIRFIHNEYLQMILDIGIIPTVIFIITLLSSLISNKNSKMNRLILLTILIHIIVDIDLQYLIIWYIIILTLNSKKIKEFTIDFNYTVTLCMIILFSIYAYYGTATFLNYIGNSELASKMLNNYTEAKIGKMLKTEDINKSHKIADEILEKNKYVVQAYKINSIYYLQNSNFEKMVENKKQQIKLDKYNIENYEGYILMLSKALEYYSQKQDSKNVEKYIDYILEAEEEISMANNNMNKLEYKIYDDPKLKLSQDMEKYINDMKKIKNNINN